MRRLALIVLVVSVSACSSMVPRLEPPRVAAASIRMVAVTSGGIAVKILLDLDNANAQDLRVDALDLSVVVGSVTVATAHTDEPLLLPASGSGLASITATADFANWSSALRRLAGKASLEYELSGVALVNGRTLPFSRHGEMKTGDLFGKPS